MIFDVTMTDAEGAVCTKEMAIAVDRNCPNWSDLAWGTPIGPFVLDGSFSPGVGNSDSFSSLVYHGPPGSQAYNNAQITWAGPECTDCNLRLTYNGSVHDLAGVCTVSIDRVAPYLVLACWTGIISSGTVDIPFTMPDTLGVPTVFRVIVDCPNQAGDGLITLSGTFSNSVLPPVSFTPNPLPAAAISIPYSVQLIGAGGTGPYTFSKIGGSFPTGLSMTSAGLISGTPTLNETQAFTILVTDTTTGADDPYGVVISTVTNIQDIVWTPVHPGNACTFGVMTAGVCNPWQIDNSATGGDPCLAGGHILKWTGSIFNPAAAYNVTVSTGYASAGNAVGAPPFNFQLSLKINATTATSLGDLSTDLPNPLSATVSLPAYQASTLEITLQDFTTPAPDLAINNVGNLTILPLTHP